MATLPTFIYDTISGENGEAVLLNDQSMQHHHYALAAGGIASDSTAVFYDMAVADDLNLNSGADQHDPSPTAAYEEIGVVAPRQPQLAADGYMQTLLSTARRTRCTQHP